MLQKTDLNITIFWNMQVSFNKYASIANLLYHFFVSGELPEHVLLSYGSGSGAAADQYRGILLSAVWFLEWGL